MPTIAPPLLDALLDGLRLSLCLGLGAAALWGLWLMIAPGAAQGFAGKADRWVPTEAWMDRLNQPIGTARWVYRHHRVVGGFIVVASAYSLWRWSVAYDRDAVLGLLDRRWISGGMDWLVPAGELIFVAFNALFLLFGLVTLLRPSLLKAPERVANRWVAVDPDKALDRRYDPLTAAVARHPRRVGAVVVILCGALLWELIALF